MDYIITQNQNIVDYFLKKDLIQAVEGYTVVSDVSDFNPSLLKKGDNVYGELPVPLVAEICNKECEFFYFPSSKLSDQNHFELNDFEGLKMYKVKLIE